MNSFERLPHHIQTLYREGCSHRDNLLAIIDTWPLGELSQVIAFKDIDSGFRDRLKAALSGILAWINTSWLEVFQGTLISQEYLMNIWRELEETLKKAEYIDATQ